MPTKATPVDWPAVARYVTARRRDLGLSFGEAITKAHVSPVTWRNLEFGRGPVPREGTLLRIAEALERPPGELFKLLGLTYEDMPRRSRQRLATAEAISVDPALDQGDKRLLAQLYERLTR